MATVHWVRPELVAEVKFLTWTDENLDDHSPAEVGEERRLRRERADCGLYKMVRGIEA